MPPSVTTAILPQPAISGNYTNHMEHMHKAHVMAIASQACCSVAEFNPDFIKVDLVLAHEQISTPVGFQLKSTMASVVSGSDVVYDMDASTHEKLRQVDGFHRFLLLMVLPDSGNWAAHDEFELKLCYGMYWLSVEGEAPLTSKYKRYRIPREQQFNPDWLCTLYTSIRDGKAVPTCLY